MNAALHRRIRFESNSGNHWSPERRWTCSRSTLVSTFVSMDRCSTERTTSGSSSLLKTSSSTFVVVVVAVDASVDFDWSRVFVCTFDLVHRRELSSGWIDWAKTRRLRGDPSSSGTMTTCSDWGWIALLLISYSPLNRRNRLVIICLIKVNAIKISTKEEQKRRKFFSFNFENSFSSFCLFVDCLRLISFLHFVSDCFSRLFCLKAILSSLWLFTITQHQNSYKS